MAKKKMENKRKSAVEKLTEFLQKEGIVIAVQPQWHQSKDTGFWSLRFDMIVDYTPERKKEMKNGGGNHPNN